MKPYYEDDLVTLYHGDCREVLLWLGVAGVMNAVNDYGSCLTAKNGATDVKPIAAIQPTVGGALAIKEAALVTDPPYGTQRYESDRIVLTGGLLRAWVSQFRTVCVFGWPEKLVELCIQAEEIPVEWITWWPTNASLKGFNLHGLLRETEAIAVFGDHALETLRRPRSDFAKWVAQEWLDPFKASPAGINIRAGEDGARCGDVWTDHSPHLGFTADQRRHPNEKPVSVMARLISGLGASVVIDPFVGSGTTLRAAKDCGLKAIGIEIEEKYCEIAAKRMAQGSLSEMFQ